MTIRSQFFVIFDRFGIHCRFGDLAGADRHRAQSKESNRVPCGVGLSAKDVKFMSINCHGIRIIHKTSAKS